MDISAVGIGALVVLLLGIVIGYRKGFIKEVISVCFTLASLVLVWFLNPYVNEFVREKTPVYQQIEESCEYMLNEKVSVWSGNLEETEDSLIDSMNLPSFFKQQIKARDKGPSVNLEETVRSVSESLAEMLVKGFSFLITYLGVIIALKILASLLNALAELPGIKVINQMAGAVLGGTKALLLIWIVLLVLTLICNTELGQKCLALTEGDGVIRLLNSTNPFMKLFMNLK